MATEIETSTAAPSTGRTRYGKMALVELGERIAEKGDKDALREVLENRFFFHHLHKSIVRPVEYIASLKDNKIARRWCGYDDRILEDAYDLTIDKFFNIPAENQENFEQSGPPGPDCRYYYKAFAQYARRRLAQKRPANTIEAELIAAEMLRRLIARHFHLSCLEAQRRAYELRRRYMWELDGLTLYIQLPIELPGRQCRKWLETNISDVDPKRPGEQDRVQAVVDRLLMRRKIVSIHYIRGGVENIPADTETIPATAEQDISVNGLAETVACEKAENIKRHRPAIRLLGPQKLKQLIHMIFAKLARGQYEEGKIADQFGLSRATFSRFAGSRWRRSCNDTIVSTVPDLWINTANTLAGHTNFVRAAQSAGVWKRVSQISIAEAKGGGF
jgi:hypothetical protein